MDKRVELWIVKFHDMCDGRGLDHVEYHLDEDRARAAASRWKLYGQENATIIKAEAFL